MMSNETKKRLILDEEELYAEIVPLLDEGASVPLTVSGGSMAPFLGDRRDTVILTKPSFPLKKGDIAFFRRENGKAVMHRVKKVTSDGYYFLGDAQTEVEGPISKDRIFASVNTVIRKGKVLKNGDLLFDLFGILWIRIPFGKKAVLKLISARNRGDGKSRRETRTKRSSRPENGLKQPQSAHGKKR